ncbi:hypothetical protein JCM19237_2239 [Photobacterium aphoticum]|uniref:Uncharacterized protein n=1 Tax=Photobacterium aphoticum TaxID=754436 RepID=A0A090QPC0_9GAMM|nr:hypothetical protein JCM19237_2239 [Photobacterium aphoticum]
MVGRGGIGQKHLVTKEDVTGWIVIIKQGLVDLVHRSVSITAVISHQPYVNRPVSG